MIHRRQIALFSLSFLDCICCGFGAIILLFVLTMGSQTEAMRDLNDRLQRIMQQQLATLAQFRLERDQLQRQQVHSSQVAKAREEAQSLQSLLAQIQQQIQLQQLGQREMEMQIEELKKDFAARQKKPELELPIEPTPIGIPAGPNHICFVIDSSGSMRDPSSERIWPIVLRKFDEVLDAYPEVKGVQFLDADGRFILGGSRADERWLEDTPETRAAIKSALFRYDIFSNSNPVPGIMRALRQLHNAEDPEMKMGLFILGDEFTGTADAVLRRLDELNPRDENGERKVIISAIGFPTAVKMGFSMGNTGVKYANLIREVCYQHGGAFIALQDIEMDDRTTSGRGPSGEP
ncbi:MAG TPA: vWA domain-containing protein [Opitutaceae bacterium]|nr:vWA domain-containing protein [Opitutaceae bacterium]